MEVDLKHESNLAASVNSQTIKPEIIALQIADENIDQCTMMIDTNTNLTQV